jgi:hypothetical protein
VIARLDSRLDESGGNGQDVPAHVGPRLDLPCPGDEVVDERASLEAGGLTEEDSDGGAVGDRFGIEILSRRGRG